MSGGGDKDYSGFNYVYPGKVTQVIDPHYFWMQLGTRESLYQFEQMQREMQKFCRQNFNPLADAEDVEPGQLVLVETKADDGIRWKRGVVTRIMASESSLDIFYMDYGNTELASAVKVCVDFPPPFKVMPPQAVRCSLAGVTPISKNWTSRGTRTFQRLTLGNLMMVLVLYGEPSFCEVSIYPGDEKNGRSVSHVLLDEEVAMAVEDQEVPEFLQDVQGFMPPVMTGKESASAAPSEPSKAESSPPSKPVASSAAKYIPPHQKNNSSSPGTAPPGYPGYSQQATPPNHNQGTPPYQQATQPGYSQLSTPASHHQTPPMYHHDQSPGYQQSTPPAKSTYLHNNPSPNKNVELKGKEPVNDFFPFENVSVYPPSPSSPVKSPEKPSNMSGAYPAGYHQGQASYFARSPSKYSSYPDGYGNNVAHGGKYPQRNDVRHNGGQRPPISRTPDRHRFAANFDNLASTFEPSYLNHQTEVKAENNSPDPRSSSYQSPVKTGNETPPRPRPRLNIPSQDSVPFHPPKSRHEPSPPAPSMAMNKASVELISPGYYQTHHPAAGDKNQSNVPAIKSYPTAPSSYSSHDSGPFYEQSKSSYSSHGYSSNSKSDHYSSTTAVDSYNHQASRNNSNNGTYQQHQAPITPPDSRQINRHSSYEKYDKHTKRSPESPESPAIADFNFSDLEHTYMVSKDHFNERRQMEKLQALYEEKEDLARESEEQSALVNMARYGSSGGKYTDRAVEEETYSHSESTSDIVELISSEIRYSSKYRPQEYEELRWTHIKNTGSGFESSMAPKLEGIPSNYMADIDFTSALKETLEFARNDGKIENTKALLDGIIESLKMANVEKQLYDVLLLMLAYAIKEYNQFHVILLDTINTLNGEMDIKEGLLKAMKRQQELCIRVCASKHPCHQNCARVLAHIYNMSLNWTDSNASIQDNLLATVEKWIFFNNKGTQCGQQEKENIFLDCFTAFWEISGPKLKNCKAFSTRILEELKRKILSENVSRNIRERLLDDVYSCLILWDCRAAIATPSQTMYTQTPKKTMIPSSCQVKPLTSNKSTWTELDWQEQEFWNIDPSTPWQQQQQPASPTLSSSPEQEVSLRPHSIPGPQHQSTPTTPITQGTSMLSSQSDSIYLTPRATPETDHTRGRVGQDDHSLNDQADQTPPNMLSDNTSQGHNSNANDAIVTASRAVDVEASKSCSSRSTSKAWMNDKAASDKQSAQGFVDWFDYEPAGSDCKLEEKKLKNKKRLDSASMNIIESGMEIKYVLPKADVKMSTRNGKEKRKARSVEPAVKPEHDRASLKHEAISNDSNSDNNAESATNLTASYGKTNTPAMKKSDKQSGNNGAAADTEAVEKDVEKLQEDWEKGVSNNTKVNSEIIEKNIDWWGHGEPPLPPVVRGKRLAAQDDGSDIQSPQFSAVCDIYTDFGPDIIIEDEFIEEQVLDEVVNNDSVEQEATKQVYKDVSCNVGEEESNVMGSVDATDSVEVSNSKREELNTDSEREKQTFSVDAKTNANTESGKLAFTGDEIETAETSPANFQDDMFAFEVDNEWDSEDNNDDDFELNGQQDTTYDADFPDSDLRTMMHGVDEAASGVPVKDKTEETYATKFPASNLAEYMKTEEQVEAVPRGRWAPGPRKCFSCHETGHNTDTCPNKFLLLQ